MREKNCSPARLIEACAKYGRTTGVPTLWIYAENDTFFPPWLARETCQAFRAAGGKAQLVMLPAFEQEGHTLFTERHGLALWSPLVSRFIFGLGLWWMAPIP